MSLSSPVFDDAHALKCELAAEVLRSSGTLRLQVMGWSMLPSIWPGDTLVVDSVDRDGVSAGDIVLFGRDRRLFAHRVVSKTSNSPEQILTRGDAMSAPDSPVSDDELLGKVSAVLRNGKCVGPRPSLNISERAVAALVRSSEIASRVVVGMRSLHPASLG